jgi:hypothetical protein
VPINRYYGPLPESSFVVASKDRIPQANVRATTSTTRGRASSSAARGRASSSVSRGRESEARERATIAGEEQV